MKFLLIFLSLTLQTSIASLLECNCYLYFNGEYACSITNDFHTPTITEVRATHLFGKSNDDVTVLIGLFSMDSQFPRGVTKFFENISTVDFKRAGLKEIVREDLQQFGRKLKKLILTNNEIETIEADLFWSTKNLEEIDLKNNKISHIEDGAFDELKKLKVFEILNNPCFTMFDYVYDAEVDETLRVANRKCKDSNYVARVRSTTESLRTTKATRTTTKVAKLSAETRRTSTKVPETLTETRTTTKMPKISTKSSAEFATLNQNLTSTLQILNAKVKENQKLLSQNLKLKEELSVKISEISEAKNQLSACRSNNPESPLNDDEIEKMKKNNFKFHEELSKKILKIKELENKIERLTRNLTSCKSSISSMNRT